jgi:hypothetical protein
VVVAGTPEFVGDQPFEFGLVEPPLWVAAMVLSAWMQRRRRHRGDGQRL